MARTARKRNAGMNATPRQKIMLFSLWKQAKRVLMNGREIWTKDEEDRRRHELTKRVLGREKSWAHLNRRSDVDLLKAGLLAIVRPDHLPSQLNALDQDLKRARFGLRQTMREMDVGDAYVGEIARTMSMNGKISSANLDTLNAAELRKVVGNLRRTQAAREKKGRIYILEPA